MTETTAVQARKKAMKKKWWNNGRVGKKGEGEGGGDHIPYENMTSCLASSRSIGSSKNLLTLTSSLNPFRRRVLIMNSRAKWGAGWSSSGRMTMLLSSGSPGTICKPHNNRNQLLARLARIYSTLRGHERFLPRCYLACFMARVLRKEVRAQSWGDWLVINDPLGSGMRKAKSADKRIKKSRSHKQRKSYAARRADRFYRGRSPLPANG